MTENMKSFVTVFMVRYCRPYIPVTPAEGIGLVSVDGYTLLDKNGLNLIPKGSE